VGKAPMFLMDACNNKISSALHLSPSLVLGHKLTHLSVSVTVVHQSPLVFDALMFCGVPSTVSQRPSNVLMGSLTFKNVTPARLASQLLLMD